MEVVGSSRKSIAVGPWLLLTLWIGSGLLWAEIPETPGAGEFYHDYAELIEQDWNNRIQMLQRETFEQVGVPIVVVTINEMADYGTGIEPNIVRFAGHWFDTWGIGSEERNVGMLILVSRYDRKARIELGADWGRRFDKVCQRLMDRDMVPRFKERDYGKGIHEGLEGLVKLAQAGPEAEPPGPGFVDRFLDNPITRYSGAQNPIAQKGGPGVIMLMVLAGVSCLVLAIFKPQQRKWLLIVGASLIVVALLFYVVVMVLVGLGVARGNIGMGGGGGGFDGGFSGGGGASGDW